MEPLEPLEIAARAACRMDIIGKYNTKNEKGQQKEDEHVEANWRPIWEKMIKSKENYR